MKRINVKDIILGKTYYKVTVGNIYKIRFYYLTNEKAYYKFLDGGFCIDSYQSDLGLDCPSNYDNNLNTIVETEQEALDIITDPQYKRDLHKHHIFRNLFNRQ